MLPHTSDLGLTASWYGKVLGNDLTVLAWFSGLPPL